MTTRGSVAPSAKRKFSTAKSPGAGVRAAARRRAARCMGRWYELIPPSATITPRVRDMAFSERRRYQRVRLVDQVRGIVDETRIVVVDVSLSGLRVLHQDELPRVGGTCVVKFLWDG